MIATCLRCNSAPVYRRSMIMTYGYTGLMWKGKTEGVERTGQLRRRARAFEQDGLIMERLQLSIPFDAIGINAGSARALQEIRQFADVDLSEARS